MSTSDQNIPQYEPDDGPLSDEYLSFFREYAKQFVPKGKLTKVSSIFDNIDEMILSLEAVQQKS